MRKSYRVKKEAEFQRVFTQGKSCANRQFVVYMIEKPEQVHFRVGISVGKKIGNAVARNWVKRRIRQSLTELKPQLKQDCDFIVIARPGVAWMEMAEVKDHLIHVLRLANVLVDEDK
ncbi:ribonuclease P protein component [Ligilactobacillus agilis]|jgi:ribonuclease P protein component|uniref:Ribonuclease P protein component n=1 Tax=Ligilactobacillus agilis TaxID=1601 RepID=A0A231QYW5_9LACO|nr:ribonuclease P protein component [Ligilactobacillus agilis]ASR41618.1 ribonuclease P protein component [Ligilactobacillus agilis]MBM6764064.1 ribonuclease P protein component [Ligilactobacillus agilis]MBM6773593.1 ribonuclease P protein component [Ligilactobacillus agilis]MCI5762805.1 ribonuclease P protein component [Ligilactobacillus agilis]MCL8204721.1 ribonuclease P protein component [Ligilactobacillus agilis]